jgi:hypothetical protein
MYLPACLISQTGGRFAVFPLIALTSSGSSAVLTVDSSVTTSETETRQKRPNLIHSPRAEIPKNRRRRRLPPTALQRTAVSRCTRPARADLRRTEVDGSESGGHAVAIGAGSEVRPRFSRMGEGRRHGGGVGRRLGLAGVEVWLPGSAGAAG